MATNYVIYNRNNKQLGLGNHIDKDGDLDAQYALLRNVALTGKMIGGKFVSDNPKHFGWLIECAEKGCPICNGIFKNVIKKDYTIKPFYMNNVVTLSKPKINTKPIPKTKWDKMAKKAVTKKRTKQSFDHPLYDLILEKFTNEGKNEE